MLRLSEPLTKEQQIHEWGLVSVLKQIHDDLDQAVADAYGWPATLTDEEILERLVGLRSCWRRSLRWGRRGSFPMGGMLGCEDVPTARQ